MNKFVLISREEEGEKLGALINKHGFDIEQIILINNESYNLCADDRNWKWVWIDGLLPIAIDLVFEALERGAEFIIINGELTISFDVWRIIHLTAKAYRCTIIGPGAAEIRLIQNSQTNAPIDNFSTESKKPCVGIVSDPLFLPVLKEILMTTEFEIFLIVSLGGKDRRFSRPIDLAPFFKNWSYELCIVIDNINDVIIAANHSQCFDCKRFCAVPLIPNDCLLTEVSQLGVNISGLPICELKNLRNFVLR